MFFPQWRIRLNSRLLFSDWYSSRNFKKQETHTYSYKTLKKFSRLTQQKTVIFYPEHRFFSFILYVDFQRKMVKLLLEIKKSVTNDSRSNVALYERSAPARCESLEQLMNFERSLANQAEFEKLVCYHFLPKLQRLLIFCI